MLTIAWQSAKLINQALYTCHTMQLHTHMSLSIYQLTGVGLFPGMALVKRVHVGFPRSICKGIHIILSK